MEINTSIPMSRTPFTHRQVLVIFSGLMACLLLSALDQTIVATTLPTIVGELGGFDYYSWVVTSYLLSATVSTPLYGKIGDLYGRRIIFQVAIVIFLIGSLLAGVAQDMLQLILFRGVQGIGAGGLITMTFSVIGDILSPRQRGRYIGLLAGVWAFASALGPFIGGFIADNLSWRWAFLINLPIGLIALVVISNVLHLPIVRRQPRFDITGALLMITGISCLLLVLVWGGNDYPWSSLVIRGLVLAGIAVLVFFIIWEAQATEPILPLHLFRNSIFSVSSVLGLLTGSALFISIIFIPLFLQVVMGVSATQSGLLLLPLTAGVVTGSVGSGRIISYTGRYRFWPIFGLAFSTVGMYLLSMMQGNTLLALSSLYMVIFGLGLGVTMQVTILAAQNAVDYQDLGVATSTVQFFRQMGGAFGVAIFGTIMNTRLKDELIVRVPSYALAEVGGEVNQLLSSPAMIRTLSPSVASGISASVEVAIHSVFLWSVPMLVLAFVLSWFLKEIPLGETVGQTVPIDGFKQQEFPLVRSISESTGNKQAKTLF